MYKLFHKLFGAYTLTVSAEDGIRLINTLTHKKILFWGIKISGDIIYLKASLFSCEAVIHTAKAEGITVTISKTVGIPFVFSKYKGRLGLLLGSLAGLFLIFYSQLFVWEINVTGNKNISEEIIINTLEKYGVKRGAFIPDLDIAMYEELFLSENTDISSISINIRGTYAEIDLLERVYPPEITDTLGYYNIVAAEDGVITKVEASSGSPEIKKGDNVIKGQLLINAYMLGRLGTYRLTHARGDVYAEVTEKFSISIPLELTEKKYTGKTETIKSTEILGKTFSLFGKDKTSYDYYDIDVTQSKKSVFGILKTPVTVTTAKYSEYKLSHYNITEDAAKIRATESFTQYLERLTEEIVSYDCDGCYNEENNAYVFTASVVIIKNIAIEKPIEIIN